MTETLSDLQQKGADYNPRDIDAGDLVRLNEHIREYGSLDGILYNVNTGNIFGGNQRMKTFPDDWVINADPHSDTTGTVRQGYITSPDGNQFPYREVDWSLEREMAANLVANLHAGRFNLIKKTEMLEQLVKAQYNMKLTGHTDEELTHAFKRNLDDSESGLAAKEFKDSLEPKEPKRHKEFQQLIDEGNNDPDALAMAKLIGVEVTLPAGMLLRIEREAIAQGLNPSRAKSAIILRALEQYFEDEL